MDVILVIVLVWSIIAGFSLVLLRAAAMGERADERRLREHRARRAAEARRRAGRVAIVAVALPLAGVTAPDASAAGCAGARSAPDRSGPDVTLCVINAERRSRGLTPVAANGRLARAARHHAADMVARRYFAHTSPDGITFVARLRHVGYLTSRCAWAAGETLAWGVGRQSTPGSRVGAWIHSRPHRQILLDPAFRDVGVGIVAGAPEGSGAGFTYTAEFGRRRC